MAYGERVLNNHQPVFLKLVENVLIHLIQWGQGLRRSVMLSKEPGWLYSSQRGKINIVLVAFVLVIALISGGLFVSRPGCGERETGGTSSSSLTSQQTTEFPDQTFSAVELDISSGQESALNAEGLSLDSSSSVLTSSPDDMIVPDEQEPGAGTGDVPSDSNSLGEASSTDDQNVADEQEPGAGTGDVPSEEGSHVEDSASDHLNGVDESDENTMGTASPSEKGANEDLNSGSTGAESSESHPEHNLLSQEWPKAIIICVIVIIGGVLLIRGYVIPKVRALDERESQTSTPKKHRSMPDWLNRFLPGNKSKVKDENTQSTSPKPTQEPTNESVGAVTNLPGEKSKDEPQEEKVTEDSGTETSPISVSSEEVQHEAAPVNTQSTEIPVGSHGEVKESQQPAVVSPGPEPSDRPGSQYPPSKDITLGNAQLESDLLRKLSEVRRSVESLESQMKNLDILIRNFRNNVPPLDKWTYSELGYWKTGFMNDINCVIDVKLEEASGKLDIQRNRMDSRFQKIEDRIEKVKLGLMDRIANTRRTGEQGNHSAIAPPEVNHSYVTAFPSNPQDKIAEGRPDQTNGMHSADSGEHDWGS